MAEPADAESVAARIGSAPSGRGSVTRSERFVRAC